MPARSLPGRALAQVHVELEEASHVSGAKWLTLMRRIVLPLVLPAFIVALAILTVGGRWTVARMSRRQES